MQSWNVLSLEGLNVLFESELSNLFNDFVFLGVVKQEVEINREDLNIVIVTKYLLEESILVLGKEVQ